MSGGVDSSVCAKILLDQGYEVEGFFMKNWDYGLDGDDCPSKIEFEDATKVGETLGIKVHGFSYIYDYKEKVFDVFLEEIKKGHTPNPDILCNKEIKFNVFLNEVKSLLNIDTIATGHYAKIEQRGEQFILGKPKDNNKDQTYFLHALNQYQLSHSLFPLAEYSKDEIRQIARDANLPVSEKKDSTGICFIGKNKFDEFISKYLEAVPGNIVSETGKVLGKHKGLICYTIGQRKGIGLGGGLGENLNAWYVAKKDVKKNELTVVQNTNHPLLMSQTITATQPHWTLEIAPKVGDLLEAQVRYRQKHQSCEVVSVSEGVIVVRFVNQQRAVAIGQSLVLYENEQCLGGGVISDYR